MLEIQRIRNERQSVIEGLKKRHFDASSIIDSLIQKDEEWRAKKGELEAVSSQLNQISKEIGVLFQQGKQAEANEAKQQTNTLKAQESILKGEVDVLDEEMTTLMYQLPNVPNELVKAGRNENDNEIVEEKGQTPTFDFTPLPHW